MEAEARAILTDAVSEPDDGGDWPRRSLTALVRWVAWSSIFRRGAGGRVSLMIVVDTKVVSELMRPVPDRAVVEWVSSAGPELCTTAVTVAEVRYGLERLAEGRRKDRLRAVADEVFTVFSDYVLPFDAEAAEQYALIVSHCHGIGRPIEGFDAQIAAICRTHAAVLATRNVKHFREAGIDLIDPWLPRTMRG
jgi:toxin FitB